MRNYTIVANWKMYSTVADAHIIATSLRNELEHLERVKVIVCPPAIWLTEVAHILHQQIPHLALGIQNVYDHQEGPFTGEISAKMAASIVQYAIVGHSERVELFREGPELINSKVHACLTAGITPIICIGEREKHNRSKEKILSRLEKLLTGLKDNDLNKIMIAYEPVWAIGANKPDSPEDANEIAAYFKKMINSNLPVIYGGSVNEENAGSFLRQENIDGLLVGRASLKIRSFVKICRSAESIAKNEDN